MLVLMCAKRMPNEHKINDEILIKFSQNRQNMRQQQKLVIMMFDVNGSLVIANHLINLVEKLIFTFTFFSLFP